jgi:UDP-glucose 4-epimerase
VSGPGAALPPPRSVLVTGAAGLVGRRLVAALADAPGPIERIVALDVRDAPPGQRRAGVEVVRGDVRDPALVATLEQHGVDTVAHLAAVVSPGPGSTAELEYQIDVLGTENVVGAAVAAGVRQLVYTSSGAAYGYHADSPRPLREDDPLRGNDQFAYARHKRLAEEILARARREHPALAQLVFRPGTILGEEVRSPISALFESRVIVGVLGADAPFVLVWDEDVARCIRQGIVERRSGIYNLTGAGSLPLREIARRLGKPYLPLPAPLLRGALALARALGLSARGGEQVDFLRYRPVLAGDRLERDFGFAPASSEECFERYRRRAEPAQPAASRASSTSSGVARTR